MKSKLYIFIHLILLSTSCVEEFDPPVEGFESLLVVEALLTDEDQPFEVKLSRSIPIDTSVWIPETKARVSVVDGSGEEFVLLETGEGSYQFPGIIPASPGESYQLHINTDNGNSYISESVIMRETPPIDSVTWKYEEIPVRDLKGIQIYVNTHDPDNNTWYYYWKWEETWTIYTPSNSIIFWEDGHIKPRDENINICWKTSKSTSILISTSKILDQDIIYNYPLYYADNYTDRFNSRYSLNVKQYALSEDSYHYMRELIKVTENLGTLFDPQPSSIYGNIHNINDKSEIVLGYFDASAVQEKRIFISNSDLPSTMRGSSDYGACEDTETLVTYDKIYEMIYEDWLLVREERQAGVLFYVMAPTFCVDCRLAGSNVKPDYWQD